MTARARGKKLAEVSPYTNCCVVYARGWSFSSSFSPRQGSINPLSHCSHPLLSPSPAVRDKSITPSHLMIRTTGGQTQGENRVLLLLDFLQKNYCGGKRRKECLFCECVWPVFLVLYLRRAANLNNSEISVGKKVPDKGA